MLGGLCLDDVEGVLLTASEIAARGRAGAGAAVDFRDAIEPEGETTAGRDASLGAGFGAVVPVNAENSVDVLDLGGNGEPEADGALGGSIDDRLLGCGGAGLEDMVVVFGEGFVGEVGAAFFTVEGEAEVGLERADVTEVVVALLEGAVLAVAFELATFFAVGESGLGLTGAALVGLSLLAPVGTLAAVLAGFLVVAVVAWAVCVGVSCVSTSACASSGASFTLSLNVVSG